MSLPEPAERIIAGWLLDQRTGTKPATKSNYGKTARLAAHDLDLLTCGPDDVAAALERWDDGVSRDRAAAILRRLFDWMTANGLRQGNPVPAGASGPTGHGPARDGSVPGPWAEPLDGWLRFLAAIGRRPDTIYAYQRKMVGFAREHPAGPRAVTDQDVVDWFAGHRWQPSTRKSRLTPLAGFYKWAIRFGHADHDPSSVIGTITVPRGLPRPVDDALFATALAHSPEARDRLMVLLAAHTGLRRAEIAAVRREDVTDHGLAVEGKGGRRRLIPLTEQLRRELLARPPGWVFPARFGAGHIGPDAVGRALARAMDKQASGHQLRHRFATRAYRGTRNLLAVQTLLGHASPATTMIYVEVSSRELEEAVAAAAA
jgi:integrase